MVFLYIFWGEERRSEKSTLRTVGKCQYLFVTSSEQLVGQLVYIYQKSSHSKYVHARQMLQTLLSTFSPTPVITTLNHNTQTDLEYSAQIGCDLLQVAFSSFMAVTIVVLLFT